MTRTAGGTDFATQKPPNPPKPPSFPLHSVWPTFVALFGLLDAQISGNYATIILFNRWQVDSFYKFLSCAPAVDGLLLLLFLQLQRNRKLFNISRKQKPLGDNFYGTMSPITNLQA